LRLNHGGNHASQRFLTTTGVRVTEAEELKIERKSESLRADFIKEVEDWTEERAKQLPLHESPSAPQVVAGKPQGVLQAFVQLQTKSHRVRARAGEIATSPRTARNTIVRMGSRIRFGFMSSLLE